MTGEITLAIDYGAKRVGVALSGGYLATPLEVLPHGRGASLVERVLQLARREQATQLVVGWPLNMDGSAGPQAEKAANFARQLAAATTLPVFLWDERRSSSEAQQQLIESGAGRKARKEKRDAVAAAVFLQDFIAQQGQGAQRVLPEGGEA
jgi:putative Holliday junction resolvase